MIGGARTMASPDCARDDYRLSCSVYKSRRLIIRYWDTGTMDLYRVVYSYNINFSIKTNISFFIKNYKFY